MVGISITLWVLVGISWHLEILLGVVDFKQSRVVTGSFWICVRDMGYCCVPCCKSTQCRGISFHKFPTCIESKRQWIIAISQQGNPRGCYWSPKGRSTICSKHFQENDYSVSTTKKILLPSAVPSIFEDLVGQKMARRQKQATSRKESSQSRLSKTKKPLPKSNQATPVLEEPKRGRGRPRKINNSSKQITAVSDAHKPSESNDSVSSKLRKTSRESVKQSIDKDLPIEKEISKTVTPIGKEIPDSSVSPYKNHNSESVAMFIDEDENSECATLPLTEEYSATGSECDRSESLIDGTAQSTTIKISKNLHLVLRKLVTTIENQRAEISRLKKERDLLSRQLFSLKMQPLNHM